MNNNKKTIKEIIEKYDVLSRDKLIPILQETQKVEGYISRESIIEIGKYLKLPASKIYGVATFYNQFRLEPIGKFHIQVCRGTACHVKGSKLILERLIQELGINPGETTRDKIFSLEIVSCIGACSLAPVICINDKYYANLTTDDIPGIIKKIKKEQLNEA
jgi:NADH-quinone oxidoreductase subunit E